MNKKVVTYALFTAAGVASALSIKAIVDVHDYKELFHYLKYKIEEGIDVNVPRELVESAINHKVNKVVDRAIEDVSDRALMSCKTSISQKAREVVDEEFRSCKKDVKTALKDKIGKIDISEIRSEVIKECKEEIKDRFEDDLDDVLDEYKDQLKTVSTIYKSIAEAMKTSG